MLSPKHPPNKDVPLPIAASWTTSPPHHHFQCLPLCLWWEVLKEEDQRAPSQIVRSPKKVAERWDGP